MKTRRLTSSYIVGTGQWVLENYKVSTLVVTLLHEGSRS